MKRIAVLISNKGTGSNLEAIIKAIKTGKIKNGKIVVVVSHKADAYGLKRAQKRKIPTEILDLKEFLTRGKTRLEYDNNLGQLLKKKYQVDLVVLAGWMLILSNEFIKYFSQQTINLHPGLLPDGKGKYIKLSTGEKIPAIRGMHTTDAVGFALEHKFPITGSTVHFITPKVDQGIVIIRGEVRIKPQDSVETLYARMKKEEHKILPLAINWYCQDKLKIKKGRVKIL